MIHNDLVFTNRNLMEAQESNVDYLHWQRLAIAHCHEAMICLAAENDVSEVAAFVAGMSDVARELNNTALALHREVLSAMSQVRNALTFHYPNARTRKVLKAALTDLADQVGSIESETGKVKDSRLNYADEVVATLFWGAMRADEQEMANIVSKIAECEKALMQFINHAQDEFFMRAAGAA